MKKITLTILIGLCISFFSFKKVVFRRGKMYYYETVYIKPNNDTLAIEKHTWKPRGRPWLLAPFQQTSVIFRYYPDSVKTMNLTPLTSYRKELRKKTLAKYKKKGKKWKGEWVVKADIGAIENEEEVWIHPKRHDHFAYTEIAPFPHVIKEKLAIDSSWESKMWFSIDNFSGTSEVTYYVKERKNYTYKNLSIDSCWQINSVSVHSKLGKNYHDFLYHPEHGFIEMKYTFYDGTKIEFYMYKITDKKNKK